MAEKRQVHASTSEAIDDFLKNGTGRGGQRNPRPGVGTFKLLLERFYAVGEKENVQLVKFPDGRQEKATTVTIAGRVLQATVLESTCAANPKGSKVDLYFRANAVKDWAQEADIADLIELATAFHACFGIKVDRVAYDAFIDATGVKATQSDVAGVEITLTTRAKTKDGKVQTFDDGTPILYQSWSPITNDMAEVQARKAALAG